MNARGTSHDGPCSEVTQNWQNWVDYILEYTDPHWHPQSELVGDFPTIMHRFEDVMEVWERYFPGFFPHKNKVTRLKVEAYRQNDIETKYKQDFEIWHSLQPIEA
jgi:hypothetical protein